MPSRVLIADDHLLSRKGIAMILSKDPEFLIVGEAADGEEALAAARTLQPDLILMDLRMPKLNGLQAIRRIKAEMPAVRIVVLSVSDDIQDFFEAIKLGAQGYLLKSMEPEEWLQVLKAVVHGDTPISRRLALQILNQLQNSAHADAEENPLTTREREILLAVAQGFSNKEIADRLGIAESTVKNHLRNLLAKLHLQSRVDLVRYAYQRRWIRPASGLPPA